MVLDYRKSRKRGKNLNEDWNQSSVVSSAASGITRPLSEYSNSN